MSLLCSLPVVFVPLVSCHCLCIRSFVACSWYATSSSDLNKFGLGTRILGLGWPLSEVGTGLDQNRTCSGPHCLIIRACLSGLETGHIIIIILSGGFSKTLMKKSQNVLNAYNSLVAFTNKHWQTEETTMIWLTFLHQKFLGKVIGICYDCAPYHTN